MKKKLNQKLLDEKDAYEKLARMEVQNVNL